MNNLKQISQGEMEEMNNLEEEELAIKNKKIDEILKLAQEYTERLVSHRTQASKNTMDNNESKKKESKRKHDRQQQQSINQEERIIQRKSTGTEVEFTYLTTQPSILKFGVLKHYQINGLNWLISLYELKMNGILADDMGLGKTIQTIAIIAFLKQFKHINGKFIIIAPLATLNNWKNEFDRWLPCCRAVILYATEEDRNKTIKEVIKADKYDVIITSYEGIKKSASDLQKIHWEYLIVDEAHKLKNESSQLSELLRSFKMKNRLLLTGTPLQNQIHELISLLNFIMPNIFKDCDTFDEVLSKKKKTYISKQDEQQNKKNQKEEGYEDEIQDEAFEEVNEQDKYKMQLIQKLHQIIKPFMLRRTKQESLKDLPPKKEIHLYVGLSDLQLRMYRNILLNKTISTVYRGEQNKNYHNTLMQLRKICIHPYLFEGVEDRSLPEYGDHLVFNSGKMVVLDKLLHKLHSEKAKANQILIFSQFTSCLDIIEDYLIGKTWNYCRIDGSTEVSEREEMMKEFQADDSNKFVFLLSTRAGGLGINLTKANFVIIFDSDFNPQIDLQAMDRAYRIGQTREVKVFRLITQYTVEEKIIERQTIKLKLDQLIIQSGKNYASSNISLDLHSIKNITQFGANDIFKAQGSTISDEDIEQILKKGEQKTDEQNKEIQKMLEAKTKGMLDLDVKGINCKEFYGEDPRSQDEIAIKQAALQSELDEKKKMYEDQYKKSKLIKVKTIQLPEYQLYESRTRLEQLLQKEEEYLARGGIMYKMGMYTQEFIDNMANNNGLSDNELKEKEEIMDKGFPYWDANDYKEFLKGCYLYGKGDYEQIASLMNKPIKEVRDYHTAFWKRGEKCISNFNYIVKKVEATERTIQQSKEYIEFVNMKMDDSEYKLENISFDSKIYKKYSSNKSSIERDQFIIFLIHKYGYGDWNRIMYEIQTHPFFSLDETFRMMKIGDIKQRSKTLYNILKSEDEKELLGTREKQKKLLEQKRMVEEKKQQKPRIKKDGESSNNTVLSRSSIDDQNNKKKVPLKLAKKDQNPQKLAKETDNKKIKDDIQNIDKKIVKKSNKNTDNKNDEKMNKENKKVDKENVNQKNENKITENKKGNKSGDDKEIPDGKQKQKGKSNQVNLDSFIKTNNQKKIDEK